MEGVGKMSIWSDPIWLAMQGGGGGGGGKFSLRFTNAADELIWRPNNLGVEDVLQYPHDIQYPSKIYIEPVYTPGPVEIVPWASGTDAQIAAMIDALDDGRITLAETGWHVGNERQVTLSAMAATGVGESHAAQTVTLVLMDSGHYDLVTPTQAGRTTDHFVVGLKDVLAELGYMNSSGTNAGSWKDSKRRAWCNQVFRMAMPEYLRQRFKQFKVISATEYNASTVTTTEDFFALFAEKEIFNARMYSNTTEAAALTQIEYYATAAHRIKKQGENGSAAYWWQRSPRASYSSNFCYVNSSGSADHNSASYTYGLAPFGCI